MMRKNSRPDKRVVEATHSRRVSRPAAAAIAARVEAARPRVVAELGWICESRDGRLSESQVAAIGAVLSHVATDVSTLPQTVTEWLAEHGADTETLMRWSRWVDSPSGTALIAAAHGAPSVRRDRSADALRRLLAVSDDEAETLGLTQLASARLREQARRRAEGIPARSARAKAEPWKNQGISKATYYRRQKKEQTTESPQNTITVEGKTSRVSIRARESLYLIDTPEVSRLVPPAAIADLPTAEGRRYAALALACGATWSADYRGPAEPENWFEMDELQAAALSDALSDAVAAQERSQRIAQARARQEPDRPPLARPPDVPAELWDAIPPDRRQTVLTIAGQLYMLGHARIDAVTIAIDGAARAEERELAIAAACPDASPVLVQQMATDLWQEPLTVAVHTATRRLADATAHLAPDVVVRARRILAESGALAECPENYRDYAQMALQRLLIDPLQSWRSPKTLAAMSVESARWREQENAVTPKRRPPFGATFF